MRRDGEAMPKETRGGGWTKKKLHEGVAWWEQGKDNQ